MDIFLVFLRLKIYLWNKYVYDHYHVHINVFMISNTHVDQNSESTTSKYDSWHAVKILKILNLVVTFVVIMGKKEVSQSK
jgi:hypothetical protein